MTSRLTSIALTTSETTEPGRNRAVDAPPHPQERLLAADGAAQRVGAVLDESPHRMAAGAVRTQVLGRGQPLLDPAVEPGVRTHLVATIRRPRGDGR